MPMTQQLKYRIRGYLYLLVGLLLCLAGVSRWAGLDYLWSGKSLNSGMYFPLIIIGMALATASYFEFLNARLSGRDRTDDNNHEED